jgi:hypothetical protein
VLFVERSSTLPVFYFSKFACSVPLLSLDNDDSDFNSSFVRADNSCTNLPNTSSTGKYSQTFLNNHLRTTTTCQQRPG